MSSSCGLSESHSHRIWGHPAMLLILRRPSANCDRGWRVGRMGCSLSSPLPCPVGTLGTGVRNQRCCSSESVDNARLRPSPEIFPYNCNRANLVSRPSVSISAITGTSSAWFCPKSKSRKFGAYDIASKDKSTTSKMPTPVLKNTLCDTFGRGRGRV